MYRLYKLKKQTADGYGYRLHNTKNHTFSHIQDNVTSILTNKHQVRLRHKVGAMLKALKLPKHYTLLAEWDHNPTKADLMQISPESFI